MKILILGILMIVLFATTISSVLPGQVINEDNDTDLQTIPNNLPLFFEPTPIHGHVYDSDTNEPISGANVRFLIYGFGKETSIEDGYYGSGDGWLFASRNCMGMAWAKGYWPTILNVYVLAGHVNDVDIYLKHI